MSGIRHDLVELIRSHSRVWPFDPDDACQKLGGEFVEVRDGVDSGGLYLHGSHPVIEINIEDSPHRQRFTKCHELAHLVLSNQRLLEAAEIKVPELNRQQEERLCDRVAADLLMPDDQLPSARSSQVTLKAIRDWSERARVGYSAAAAKLIEASGDPTIFLRLERFASGWYVTSSIAANHLGEIRIPLDTGWHLDSAARISEDIDRRLSFSIGNQNVELDCEIRLFAARGNPSKSIGKRAMLLARGF